MHNHAKHGQKCWGMQICTSMQGMDRHTRACSWHAHMNIATGQDGKCWAHTKGGHTTEMCATVYVCVCACVCDVPPAASSVSVLFSAAARVLDTVSLAPVRLAISCANCSDTDCGTGHTHTHTRTCRHRRTHTHTHTHTHADTDARTRRCKLFRVQLLTHTNPYFYDPLLVCHSPT